MTLNITVKNDKLGKTVTVDMLSAIMVIVIMLSDAFFVFVPTLIKAE
jgi:hypothetical protein